MQGNSNDFDSKVPFILSNKKKNKIVRYKARNIFLLIFCFCLSVCLIVIFLAKGTPSSIFSIKGAKFYCIQMGEYTVENDAQNKSKAIRLSGGSGYILNDGIFHVMAAVYNKESDFKIVFDRFSELGIDCKRYEIAIPKLRAPLYDDKKTSNEIAKYFQFPITTLFNKLYSLSIQLDKAEISESLVLLEITNIEDEIQKKTEEIEIFTKRFSGDVKLLGLKELYLLLDQTMKDIHLVSSADTLMVKVKYALNKIVFNYYRFIKQSI